MPFPEDPWPPLYLSRGRMGTLSTPLVNTLQPSMSHKSVEWPVCRHQSTSDFLQCAFSTTYRHPISHSSSGIRTGPLQMHLFALDRGYFCPTSSPLCLGMSNQLHSGRVYMFWASSAILNQPVVFLRSFRCQESILIGYCQSTVTTTGTRISP